MKGIALYKTFRFQYRDNRWNSLVSFVPEIYYSILNESMRVKYFIGQGKLKGEE